MQTGTELYYTGDQANHEGFFKVIEKNGGFIKIAEIDGSRTFTIHSIEIANKYEGHCGQRFVTRAAFNAYRDGMREFYKHSNGMMMGPVHSK